MAEKFHPASISARGLTAVFLRDLSDVPERPGESVFCIISFR
jgi:hypothetical protein